MTNTRSALRLFLLPLAMSLSGCLEIETTTTVHTDGSIQREVQFSGDSAEVTKGSPFFPTDSTWTVIRRRSKDTAWTSVSAKVFADGAALQQALNSKGDKGLNVRVEFAKRFLWFTTEFSYRETILCYNQFQAVPISAYISPDDLAGWVHYDLEKAPYPSVEDSLRIRKASLRAEEWDSRNKFEAFFLIFAEGAARLNDPGLSRGILAGAKESLYVHCAKALTEVQLDTIPVIFQHILKTPLVQKVFDAESGKVKEFAEKIRFEMDLLGTPYKRAQVIMPGVITETNARSIQGNTLTWEEFIGASYAVDYTMWARSRVINWWAVVLTGAVVIVLAGILVIGTFRRRRVVPG